MQCPKCHNVELLQAKSKSTGVLVDHCPQCQGVWCDRGELERMLEVVAERLDVPRHAKLSSRKCPRCSVRLRAISYRGTFVAVDACPQCAGIWLDRGELQRIRDRRQLIDRDMQRDKYARRGRPMPRSESPAPGPRVAGAVPESAAAPGTRTSPALRTNRIAYVVSLILETVVRIGIGIVRALFRWH